jgi:hexosaminidase
VINIINNAIRTSCTLSPALYGSVSFLFVPSLYSSLHGQAPALHVMPLPRSVQAGTGELLIGKDFYAGFDGQHDARMDAALNRFLMRLERQSGYALRSQSEQSGSPVLIIKVAGPGEAVQSTDEDESYKLVVTATGAKLRAATDVSAIHGLETFLQLVETSGGTYWLPGLTTEDAPRFPWRGLLLDVSRHFESISTIERTLDAMAVAKLNVFHWHLSDDQGFRAESKLYPRLTQMASEGHFYTQDEMRHVVEYARARGIRIVPEFDMPGHATSWLVAYPEIGAVKPIRELPQEFGIHDVALDQSNEETYKFIDGLIGEIATIFPDAYFHIGSDETKGKDWLENPRVKAFMDEQGFKTPAELQLYFNRRLLPILAKHGKKMMGWDEILQPALPKDIVLQSWRGWLHPSPLTLAAEQGYTGILSAPYYLDLQKSS